MGHTVREIIILFYTCVEAVQVGDRDDEGGGAEEEEDQHLPHPEPVVDRGPHSNT